MLLCVCSVNRSQRTSKCGKNISDTLGYCLVCHFFCSYHILTSSVIYYWTDARQHGIYLLKRFCQMPESEMSGKAKQRSFPNSHVWKMNFEHLSKFWSKYCTANTNNRQAEICIKLDGHDFSAIEISRMNLVTISFLFFLIYLLQTHKKGFNSTHTYLTYKNYIQNNYLQYSYLR